MAPASHLLKIHLNIIFPSTLRSLSLTFPRQNPVYASPFPIRATCPAHHILLEIITRTILGDRHRSLNSSLCSFFPLPCYLVPLQEVSRYGVPSDISDVMCIPGVVTGVHWCWYTVLAYSIEQSPSWEANRFSVRQEIDRTVWNQKVHYRIHKCPPPVPILIQLDPVHTPTSHILNIHLNIILPFMPGSPKWSLSFRFPYQNPLYASRLPHTRYMPRPSHSSRFYYPNNIWWAVQIIKLLIM